MKLSSESKSKRGTMPRKGEKLYTISNEYTIGESIGNGGAGSVFNATSADGECVAVKILNSKANTKQRKRFIQELNYCEKAKNPSIIKVLDKGLYFSAKGERHPFYVMPLCACSLRTVFKEQFIEPPEQFAMLLNLLQGIQRFHAEGNVHRDIKPENILLSNDEQSLLLADFGIAHIAESYPGATVVTAKDDRLANFNYASPEQRSGSTDIDKRSDIFSLGLIIVEMFTGDIPYGTEFTKTGDWWADYAFLDEVTDKMLMQNRDDRFSDLDEVLTAIHVLSSEHEASLNLERMKADEATIVDGDYDISVESMRWESGSVLVILNKQPDELWIDCFHGHPKNYFDTSGYRFGPQYWTPTNACINIPNVGNDEMRVREIKDSLPAYIAWANQTAIEESRRREERLHQQRIATAKANYERAKAETEASRAMNAILSE